MISRLDSSYICKALFLSESFHQGFGSVFHLKRLPLEEQADCSSPMPQLVLRQLQKTSSFTLSLYIEQDKSQACEFELELAMSTFLSRETGRLLLWWSMNQKLYPDKLYLVSYIETRRGNMDYKLDNSKCERNWRRCHSQLLSMCRLQGEHDCWRSWGTDIQRSCKM